MSYSVSITGSSSTVATAEMQGLRLIDCQSLLASVKKRTWCAGSEGKIDSGFLVE